MNEVNAVFGDIFLSICTTDDALILEESNPNVYSVNCKLSTNGFGAMTAQMFEGDLVKVTFPYQGAIRSGEFLITNIANNICCLKSSGEVI